MKIYLWRLIPLFLFALLLYFFWQGLSLEPQKLPSVQINKPLPQFELNQLGKKEPFTNQSMHHEFALINVWASWCAACVEEEVFLMQLAREGVVIYGLNYKDSTENAEKWLKEWGNPYRAIAEDKKGKVAIDLGVYGAPETFLIDKKGIIRYRHIGVLDEQSWKKHFLPLIHTIKDET